MKPDDFTATYGPLAEDISRETGLAPHAILGIVAQETGFGDHFVGNNIFGISPSGPRGQYVAQYPSIQDASRAFVDLIKSRYQDANSGATPEDQVRLISARGYNTNPAYPGAVSQRIATLKGSGQQQMASDDDLMQRIKRLRQAAPEAATGGPATTAAPTKSDTETPSDDALLARIRAIAPAPPPAATATPQEKPPAQDPYSGAPTSADIPPWMMRGPPGQSTDERVRNMLAPAPNTTYGDVLPIARDETTGALRFAMPNMLRSPLIGLTSEGPTTAGTPGATFNPETGTFGVTPEAASVVPFVAGVGGRDIRFVPRGGNPLEFVPPARSGGPLPSDTAANLLSPDARVRATEQPAGPTTSTGVPVTPPVPPPAGGTGPQPVGAQASTAAQAGMTREEAAIATSQAEHNKLMESQPVGVRDTNIYVKGSDPNVAQIEQTVHAARELKDLKNQDTTVSQEAREIADRANAARQTHYAEDAGSQPQVANMEKARDESFTKGIDSVWANKSNVNLDPVRALGQKILDGPAGKEDVVVSNVKAILDKLRDRGGNLETDPEMAYGVRKEINNRLSKEAQIEKPTNQLAARQLIQLRDAIDEAMDPASLASGARAPAPGFRAVLARYAEDSKPIEAMRLLQEKELGLFDSQNRMQYSRVQRMMREATAARHPDAALNPWQSLTSEQMDRLWALRDDLRRSASAEDLARAQGSDTAPNFMDAMRRYGSIAAGATPILGPMIYRTRALLDPLIQRRTAQQAQRRGMEMLYPDPNQYPLRNPLSEP